MFNLIFLNEMLLFQSFDSIDLAGISLLAEHDLSVGPSSDDLHQIKIINA